MDGLSLRIFIIIACVVLLPTVTGCNVYSSLDTPSGDSSLYADAIAKANQGDCQGAIALLNQIKTPDDNVESALGWAQLCIAGATANNLATSLYSYTSSSSNVTVIGKLAQTMLPMNGTKFAYFDGAINDFEKISDTSQRNLETAVAQFAKAAGVLAEQAANQADTSLLTVDDVSDAACKGVTCTTGSAACSIVMPDADVTTFINAISSAATALSAINAKDLKALATAINAGLGGSTSIGRCYIYNNAIPTN